jgi:hypothetical protein
MMTREDRQEALSLAYVHAVDAMCGMTHSSRSKDYGVDITLHEVQEGPKRYFESGVSLDVQMKSTSAVIETRTTISIDLPVKGYDLLRLETDQARILAVLVLPADETQWLRQNRAKLEIRKCVYWLSLRGRSPVSNRSSIRIDIPKQQLFTVDALREIMDRVRRKEKLT